MKERPTPSKLQVVDLTRSFAILSVLAFHMYGMSPQGSSLSWLFLPLQKNGAYGVSVFFVVSGFLITRLLDGAGNRLFRPDAREFYVRRAARILPLLFFHVSLGAYLVHGTTHFSPWFWVSILIFAFNWFQAFVPNPVPGLYWGLLWSLSVEEQFYLFFPPLLRALGKTRGLVFFMGGLVLLGPLWRSGYQLGGQAVSLLTYKTSPGAFDQIASGVLLFLASKAYGKELLKKPKACLGLCLSGLLVLAWTYAATDITIPFDCIYSPTLIALGTFLFLLGGLHLRWFESGLLKPFSWTGKFSYAIYLFHPLLYIWLYPRLLQGRDFLTAFFLFALLSTLVMAVCYYGFEMPMNRWVRRTFGVKSLPG